MQTATGFSFLYRKTGKLALTLFLVAVIAFTLVSMSPINPVTAYIGIDRMQISAEQEQLIIERWGLDQPPLDRFFLWCGNLLQGDLGRSVLFNEPVAKVIGKRFVTSLWLMASAWLLSGLLGFTLGVVAGTWRGSPLDQAIRLYAYLLASTPAFWVGLVLLSVFSVAFNLTPICCAAPPGVPLEEASIGERLHHLLLPALTLSITGIAQIALHTREKMIEAMHSDYALFAMAQGEGRCGVAWRHALRNVALPAVTLQFASLSELFGGSVLTEQVFAYPGLGKATVDAGIRGDVPLLLGITLFSALFVFSGNLMADLLYTVLDPRIRTEGDSDHAGY